MSNYKFKTVKSDWFALISSIFCQLIILLGYYVLLGGLKLGDEALGVSGVDETFVEFRYNGDFIFYDR